MRRASKLDRQSVNFAKETLKQYWIHIRKNRMQFYMAFVLVPASALALATYVPYYLSQAVGALAEGNQDVSGLLYKAVAWGVAGVIFNYVGFKMLVFHEAKMHTYLIGYLTEQLLAKDYSFFSNEKVGALTTKFNDFVRAYVVLQDLFIIRTLGFIIAMGLGLVLVAQASLHLAALLLGLIVFLFVQIRFTMKYRQPYRTERKYIRSKITGEVADTLTNNLVVKTFAQEDHELESVTEKTKRHMKLYVKDIGIVVTDGSLRQLVTTAVQIIAIIFCIALLKSGSIDIAAVVFALAYLQRVAAQIFGMGEMINGYDNAFLEAAPMTEMLLKESAIKDSPNAANLEVSAGAIDFNNLSYAYEDGKIALSNFNYKIKGGQKIGIVGHSGAGKTTITRLLLRFDDVSSGSIDIDGHDISQITQVSLREAIAYVPQEPLLFHRTLGENISYGNLKATTDELIDAAKKAHAHEFIKELPRGYETVVGERGVKLSGGQRQRIAIARAILKNSPILVLDEATSALDSESEKLIQDALQKLMENRTTIVIAHRLSTIQKMDKIIVLDKGVIVEEGTHSQLLQTKGTYSKLWTHQSGGFLDE